MTSACSPSDSACLLQEIESLKANFQFLSSSLDGTWVLVCGILVFVMQLGFTLLEAGSVRAINTKNIIMQNLLDTCVTHFFFWVIGYNLYFADRGKDGYGNTHPFIGSFSLSTESSAPNIPSAFFLAMFCNVASTIVSGAVTSRVRFGAYMGSVVLTSSFVFPLVAHWCWGGGWLWSLGYIDFAGGTVVHMLGGVSGLMGAIVVGPRHGRFKKDENGVWRINQETGHSVVLSSIGTFLLWFGWFGFNAGSTLGISGNNFPTAARAALNTILTPSVAGMTVAILDKYQNGVSDLWLVQNGVLTGLVAITPSCATIDGWGAIILGLLSGVAFIYSKNLLLRLRIDDVVDAFSVHGTGGIVGTICLAFLSTSDFVTQAYDGHINNSIIKQLGVQILGVVSIFVFAGAASLIYFLAYKKIFGDVRVSIQDEKVGLDFKYHAGYAYPDFNARVRRAREQLEADLVSVFKRDLKLKGKDASRVGVMIQQSANDAEKENEAMVEMLHRVSGRKPILSMKSNQNFPSIRPGRSVAASTNTWVTEPATTNDVDIQITGSSHQANSSNKKLLQTSSTTGENEKEVARLQSRMSNEPLTVQINNSNQNVAQVDRDAVTTQVDIHSDEEEEEELEEEASPIQENNKLQVQVTPVEANLQHATTNPNGHQELIDEITDSIHRFALIEQEEKNRLNTIAHQALNANNALYDDAAHNPNELKSALELTWNVSFPSTSLPIPSPNPMTSNGPGPCCPPPSPPLAQWPSFSSRHNPYPKHRVSSNHTPSLTTQVRSEKNKFQHTQPDTILELEATQAMLMMKGINNRPAYPTAQQNQNLNINNNNNNKNLLSPHSRSQSISLVSLTVGEGTFPHPDSPNGNADQELHEIITQGNNSSAGSVNEDIDHHDNNSSPMPSSSSTVSFLTNTQVSSPQPLVPNNFRASDLSEDTRIQLLNQLDSLRAQLLNASNNANLNQNNNGNSSAASVAGYESIPPLLSDSEISSVPSPRQPARTFSNQTPSQYQSNHIYPPLSQSTLPGVNNNMNILPPPSVRIIIPARSAWFSFYNIDKIERRSLPEFFNASRTLTSKLSPAVYLDFRNWIILAYWQSPFQKLSASKCRRQLPADAITITRLHSFLDYWGLINSQTANNTMNPSTSNGAPSYMPFPKGVSLPSNNPVNFYDVQT